MPVTPFVQPHGGDRANETSPALSFKTGGRPTDKVDCIHPADHTGELRAGWLQVLLGLQRDWTRKATYDAARAVIARNGGSYGIGLNYARDMLPR
ncbi:hypothetical protein [Variovorax sp. ZT4R33]|uniref:hypothetical protein n=1 Tax=Variovorax sp. ZT4R33 TaxID=3443743 RepID=UPI003F47F0C4